MQKDPHPSAQAETSPSLCPFFVRCIIDLFIGILIAGDPFIPFYAYLLVPPMILLHLFSFWVMLKPYERLIAAFCGAFSS